MDKDIMHKLCNGELVKIDNEKLANLKQYRRNGCSQLIIFEPPVVGHDVFILEHYVDRRHLSENNFFQMEYGFDRKCVIYHVKEHQIYGGNYYNPNNRVVLTYKIRQGQERERFMNFSQFFCGFNCSRTLDGLELEYARQRRREVDDEFDIRRF